MTDLQGATTAGQKPKIMIESVSANGVELAWLEAKPHFAEDMAQFFKGKRTPRIQRSMEFDLGLFDVISDEPFGEVAKLPLPQKGALLHAQVRAHLVGYPLGIGPYHTEGEVGPLVQNGTRMLRMLTAQGIPGNSGGGIFRSDTQELIGIFSKVMTMNGATVPHMGLFVPIADVYYWFYFVGLSAWIPKEVTTTDLSALPSTGPIVDQPVAGSE